MADDIHAGKGGKHAPRNQSVGMEYSFPFESVCHA